MLCLSGSHVRIFFSFKVFIVNSPFHIHCFICHHVYEIVSSISFLSLYNKLPHAQWLKTTHVYDLTISFRVPRGCIQSVGRAVLSSGSLTGETSISKLSWNFPVAATLRVSALCCPLTGRLPWFFPMCVSSTWLPTSCQQGKVRSSLC